MAPFIFVLCCKSRAPLFRRLHENKTGISRMLCFATGCSVVCFLDVGQRKTSMNHVGKKP